MKRVLHASMPIVWFVLTASPLSAQMDEYNALLKIQQETSADTRIQLGEDFLQKYPKSTYAPNVHQQLVYAYNQTKNPNKADKVIEHGEAARSIKDPVMLYILASAYDEKKADDKSLEAAKAAIDLLSGADAPSSLSPEQKNQLLSMNQYLMGAAYYRQAKQAKSDEKNSLFLKARASLETATKSNPKNDLAYYQLGLTHAEMSQGTAACEALAKAVVLEGPAKPYAQQDLEKIYMYYNKKPKAAAAKDLDKLLAKAKADMQ